MNLLENAIRFTPKDTTIEISAEPMNEATVEVADRGPGLQPGRRDRYSISSIEAKWRSRGRRGFRFGHLSWCRGIARRPNLGREPTRWGCVFRFTLPIVGKPPEVEIDA